MKKPTNRSMNDFKRNYSYYEHHSTLAKMHYEKAEQYLKLVDESLYDINSEIEEEIYFNTDEAAKYLGYSAQYIKQLTCQKKIPFQKINGGKLQFKKSELDTWRSKDTFQDISKLVI